jgi:hypothetical protein
VRERERGGAIIIGGWNWREGMEIKVRASSRGKGGGGGGVIWAWWNGLRISGIYVGSDFFRVVLEGVSLHAGVTQHPLEDVGL